jgi:hypothetical protein
MRQASFSVGVSIVTGGSPNGNGCFISWNIRKWIADDSWKYPHDLGKKSMFTYVFLKKMTYEKKRALIFPDGCGC